MDNHFLQLFRKVLLTRDIEFIIAEVMKFIKYRRHATYILRQHDDVIRKRWQLVNQQKGMCERRETFKMAWNQQIVYGRSTGTTQNEIHALNFLAILEIKYTNLPAAERFFLTSSIIYGSTVTSPCYHPFANSCICGFNARTTYVKPAIGKCVTSRPKQRDWPKGKYCAIKCLGRSLRGYANFSLPWGVAWGNAWGKNSENFEIFEKMPEA
ncbi:hypothetical protein T4C_9675 [Trichinella pseudospiralis]|uniref:Uncharacterized protein n=1 Tax=Trichinella pseudospiralis TaxID=6337 RepID=A0A0V1K101_TRIPS|nr:hypothetical protein T4C_9675 [Trichinella pseudospiralis]